MLEDLVPFLAILNPFALCLYLVSVMEELSFFRFLRVLSTACAISLGVFWAFALGGEALLKAVGVRTEAMRIFGGVVFFIVAYNYVTKGYRAAEQLRGSIEELPAAIALPFMIGAGTITQSILIGKHLTWAESLVTLAVGIGVALGVILLFHVLREHMNRRGEKLFDRWVNILARVNGLIIGAVSAEMIISGVYQIWTQG